MCVYPQGCRFKAQRSTIKHPAREVSVQSFCCILKTWYTFLSTSPFACFLLEAGSDAPPPHGQLAVPAAVYLHIPPWRQTDGTVD